MAQLQREAATWARAWGFAPNEWIYASRPHAILGRRACDGDIVFVCGSQPIPPELLDQLEVAGFDTYVDAHDLDTFHEPRSALDNLPLRPLPRVGY